MKPEEKLKATFDGSSGFGSHMLPTETANEIIKRVFDESWARNLFRSYKMKTETTNIPKLSTGGTMYGTTGNKNTAATESRHATTEVTLTMKTIIGNMPVDKKTLGYSIEVLMPTLKDDIVDEVLDTEEDVIINGDTTAGASNINGAFHATNYPFGIGAQDARLEMDGLRHFAIAAQANHSNAVNASGTALSLSHLRQAFGKLQKHGRKKRDLIILCSLTVANTILGIEELETLEKYGPKATILTGEVGRMYGARVISTSLIPENLGIDGLKQSQAASPTGYTIVLVFNYKSPIIGDPIPAERKFRVDVENEPKKDQIVLIPKEDFAFNQFYSNAIMHIYGVLPGE